MAERVGREAEVRQWRTVVELTEAKGAAGNALRVARERYERIEYLAERAEREIRERARREVAEWAAGVLADPNTVVLSLAGAGSGDRVSVVEVALLNTEGKTLLHERVRADRSSAGGGEPVALDEGSVGPRGRAKEDPTDPSTLAETCLRLREALNLTGEEQAPARSGRRRVVVFDAPGVLRVLACHLPEVLRVFPQRIARDGSEESAATSIEDARLFYSRAYGEWSIVTEDYCLCRFLPGGDGTPLGDARATLELVEKLAAEHGGSTPGASSLWCPCPPKGDLDSGICARCDEGMPTDEVVPWGDVPVCRTCTEKMEDGRQALRRRHR